MTLDWLFDDQAGWPPTAIEGTRPRLTADEEAIIDLYHALGLNRREAMRRLALPSNEPQPAGGRWTLPGPAMVPNSPWPLSADLSEYPSVITFHFADGRVDRVPTEEGIMLFYDLYRHEYGNALLQDNERFDAWLDGLAERPGGKPRPSATKSDARLLNDAVLGSFDTPPQVPPDDDLSDNQ